MSDFPIPDTVDSTTAGGFEHFVKRAPYKVRKTPRANIWWIKDNFGAKVMAYPNERGALREAKRRNDHAAFWLMVREATKLKKGVT